LLERDVPVRNWTCPVFLPRHLRFISRSADAAIASSLTGSPRVLELGTGAGVPSQVIPEPGAAAALLLAAPLLLRRRRQPHA
jgi:MYXO-CTERM domain-containing protein